MQMRYHKEIRSAIQKEQQDTIRDTIQGATGDEMEWAIRNVVRDKTNNEADDRLWVGAWVGSWSATELAIQNLVGAA